MVTKVASLMLWESLLVIYMQNTERNMEDNTEWMFEGWDVIFLSLFFLLLISSSSHSVWLVWDSLCGGGNMVNGNVVLHTKNTNKIKWCHNNWEFEITRWERKTRKKSHPSILCELLLVLLLLLVYVLCSVLLLCFALIICTVFKADNYWRQSSWGFLN